MKVTKLRIQGFRSFEDSGDIALSQINVLVGPNNSGKSTVLKALHSVQAGYGAAATDVRQGSPAAAIAIEIIDIRNLPKWGANPGEVRSAVFSCTMSTQDGQTLSSNNQVTVDTGNSFSGANVLIPNREPNHFIVPFLSRRKTIHFTEQVTLDHAMQVSLDMSMLSAKLSRVANPVFPAYEHYSRACKEILGFVVTSIPSQSGQLPGIYLPSMASLPISQMGDGVPHIVHLLANLVTSQGKLFLIEEPENDLHPQALKALLDLIVESAKSNQFVISTHSNIVVSHLCAAQNSRLFNVSAPKEQLPTTATISGVAEKPEARLEVLRELGYAFSDLALWEGWLILEEASAETIIRDYLIPMFAPGLRVVRTISASGVDRVEPTLDDLNRLVLFLHLEPAYKGRAWVRVDGDAPGCAMVERLKSKYADWPEHAFATFTQTNFENYYPSEFLDQATAALSLRDGARRREEKRHLLTRVQDWLDQDIARAKSALKVSAAEVISQLQAMERHFARR
jgi:predicted ATPase